MIGSTCPVCVDVPQPNRAPSFNIPSTASDKRDILCTVVRTTEEGKCLNLNATCDGFNETSFASSLTICSSTSSSTDYRMCFSSITEKMNNTKIHFFYSSSPFCPITSRRVTSRLYIDSYEIIAQGTYKHILSKMIIIIKINFLTPPLPLLIYYHRFIRSH